MLRYFFTGRRLLMTLLVVAGAAVLCGLGGWQWSRHLQREALNQRITARMAAAPVAIQGAPVDPEALDYRRVTLRGTFDDAQSVLLRNRSYSGTTGYHLVTPLRLSGADAAVLVDRGWVPLTTRPEQARVAYAAPGEVTIEGVARMSQPYAGGPADPPLSAERPRLDAWFRVDVERIQQQVGYPLLPVFVEIQPGAQPADGPPFPSATSDLGPGSHVSYALQWYSFAIILVVGYIVLMVRQRRHM